MNFAPTEHEMIIREKLRNIRQKGTVEDYNAAFNKLSMQLQDISFKEEEFAYFKGLKLPSSVIATTSLRLRRA